MDRYRLWAAKISASLSPQELDEFVALLDGDADDSFLHEMNTINIKKNPQSYTSTTKRRRPQ